MDEDPRGPGVGEPGAGEPRAGEPRAGEPGVGEPGAGDSGAVASAARGSGGEPGAAAIDGEELAADAALIALHRAQAAAREKGLRPGRGPVRRRREESPGMGRTVGDGRDPLLLGRTSQELSRQLGWNQPLSIGGVIGRWADVVGPQIAEHCSPETFEEGVLVVRTDSTAWATQIQLLLPQLERRLAEEVGDDVVTSIKVLGPGGPSWRKGPRSVRGRGPRDTYG